MAEHGIPGSYDGIHRNIIRESSGNPQDRQPLGLERRRRHPVQRSAGGHPADVRRVPRAGHLDGHLDPVANITAACNDAATTYGSIDNVFGAY